jgi:SAM-dependent methyltransferase
MSEPAVDRNAFRAFEKAAHDRIAQSYHNAFSVVTDRAIEPLLAAARVGAGTRLLDVAAGPGTLTAKAAARGADVTGVDLSSAMVALARQLHPGIEFREASADALPFPAASFDAVTCSFGLGHFASAEHVLAEFARVLATGGVAALSWWAPFAQNRINGVFYETVQALGARPPGTIPAGPPIDRFSDHERLSELLRAAGFDHVAIDEVTFTHALRDADELWELAMGSFARVSSVILAQDAELQARIRAGVAERAAQYASANGLAIPVAFRIVSGTRDRP